MKKICIIASVFAVSAMVSAPAISAQEDEEEENVQVFDMEELGYGMRVDPNECWFVEGSVSDAIDDQQSYRELLTGLSEVEPDVRQYVNDSVLNTERAIGMALRDFSAWYTHRVNERNADEIATRRVGEIVATVLPQALNYALPGSGVVVTFLRRAGVGVYNQILSSAPTGNTDPQPYLDRIAERMEDNSAERTIFVNALFNDTTNQALMNQVEAIKFEYLMERNQNRLAGRQGGGQRTAQRCAEQMMNDIGVRRATPANATRVRMETLSRLIEEVICIDQSTGPAASAWNCQTGDRWQAEYFAEMYARRIIAVNRNMQQVYNLPANLLPRICPLETSNWRRSSPDCDRWRASQN